MSERWSRFATRFRRAIQTERQAAEAAQAAAEATAEAAAAARDALLAQLAQLAHDIGALDVQSGPDGLTLRFGERSLRFAPEGDGELLVSFEGIGEHIHRLFRQPELQDRWIYARGSGQEEVRLPLLDQGLEELLVRGLGLPRPGEEPIDEPAGATDPADPASRRL